MVERDGSRLPADPGYWDGLAGRIQSRASGTFDSRVAGAAATPRRPWVPALAAAATPRRPWVPALAAAATPRRPWVPALAAAAVLAVVGTWLGTDPPAPVPASPIARALQPTDPLAEALLADPLPPDIGTLLRTLDPLR